MIAEFLGLVSVAVELSVEGDLDEGAIRQAAESAMKNGGLMIASRGLMDADGADLTVSVTAAADRRSAALFVTLDQGACLYRDESIPCTAMTVVAVALIETDPASLLSCVIAALRAHLGRLTDEWRVSNEP